MVLPKMMHVWGTFALCAVACGSYGSTNVEVRPDASADAAGALIDAGTFAEDAKRDAPEASSPVGVCIPTLGAFCEDFDVPARFALGAPEVIGSGRTVLLDQDGFTAPHAMRFEFPANMSSRLRFVTASNILNDAVQFSASLYVRVPRTLPNVNFVSLSVKDAYALQVATTGASVTVAIQLKDLAGVDINTSSVSAALESQLVGIATWQRIEIIVDHTARTLALAVPGSVKTTPFPANAAIAAVANPQLFVGAGEVPVSPQPLQFDIDSVEMRKVR
jgi:hypothetical protein